MVRPRKDDRTDKIKYYIGEFVYNFGAIESWINEIFLELFDLERLRFMFIGLIDFRKKITLVREGFKEKGDLAHDDLLQQVHDMANLRNVIAHSCFHDAEGGISVDHVTHQGIYGWKKKKRGADIADTYISFDEFDRYFEQQEKMIEQLWQLYENTTPIPSFSREFAMAIDEIIDSSPNVVRYAPRQTPTPKVE